MRRFQDRGIGLAEAAIAAVGLIAGLFVVVNEDTEAALFGLAFVGLVAGWALGIPRRALLLLAVTITLLISVVLLGGLGQSGLTSTVGHVVVSGLLGWGLSPPVWDRFSSVRPGGRRAVLTVVAIVLVLGVAWEIGELVADRLLGTALSPDLADTLLDLFADGVGALAGAMVAARGAEPAATSGAAPGA